MVNRSNEACISFYRPCNCILACIPFGCLLSSEELSLWTSVSDSQCRCCFPLIISNNTCLYSFQVMARLTNLNGFGKNVCLFFKDIRTRNYTVTLTHIYKTLYVKYGYVKVLSHFSNQVLRYCRSNCVLNMPPVRTLTFICVDSRP